MFTSGEGCNFFDDLARPACVWHPHAPGREHVRDGVETHDLVVRLPRLAPRGAELTERYAQRTKLLNERSASGLLLDQARIRIPFTVVLDGAFLQVRERPTPLDGVKQDDVRVVIVLLVEPHTPRGAGAVVSGGLGLVRRVPRLDDVLALRRLFGLPDTPGLALDDRRHLRGGVLHVLRLPEAWVHARTLGLQLLQGPLLRPQALLFRRVLVQDGGKLDDLPLVSVRVLDLVLDQHPGEVNFTPPRHDDDDGAPWHQALERTGLEPVPRRIKRRACACLDVLFRVRIVNNEQICAPASDATAYTDGVILPTFGGGPLSSCFLVLRHAGFGKNGRVDVSCDEVFDPTPEILRQGRSVRAHNDLFVRKFAQKVGRKQV